MVVLGTLSSKSPYYLSILSIPVLLKKKILNGPVSTFLGEGNEAEFKYNLMG